MRRLNDEEGAVAVVVAIMLVVLLGFGAFAVDVGQLYQERRELQNGADAAAMAAAYDCAKGVIECSVTGLELNATIDDYASANANDGASAAEMAELDLVDKYVTVETETLSGGNGFLTHWFAWAFDLFNAGSDSATTTVRAQATAQWDRVPGTLEIFPLVFCLDTFNKLTSNGTSFGPPEYHVFYKTPSKPVECPTSDGIYEGGFGWLDIEHPDVQLDPATCTLTINSDEWIPGVSGVGSRESGPWPACYEKLKQKIIEMDANPSAAPLLVPIFDGWKKAHDFDDKAHPPKNNGMFHIAGFGAFRPTGYNLGGATVYPDNKACLTAGNRCIRGWFTDFVTVAGSGVGGKYYGVVSVDLIR